MNDTPANVASHFPRRETRGPLWRHAALVALRICLAIVLPSCGSDFDPSSRVTGLRLLATRADAPFAAPGEEVHLESLVTDGLGRSYQVAWGICERPASTTATGCLQSLPIDTQPLAVDTRSAKETAASTFSFVVPEDALAGIPEAGRRSLYYGVVEVACPGIVRAGPSPEGLPLSCSDPGGALLALGSYDIGVKRVFVRERDRNANPEIAAVTFDGLSWPEDEIKTIVACASATDNQFDRCEGESHAMSVTIPETSFESGVDEFGATFAEQLLVDYYATDGIFEYETRDARQPVTRFKARQGAVGSSIDLWIVVHDDRGGVTWAKRTLSVVGGR
jgi:hypothetical protein